jgi:hypothetical protein
MALPRADVGLSRPRTGAKHCTGHCCHFIRKIVDGFGNLLPHLEEVARNRGNELLAAHRRVRAASLQRNVSYRVDPSLPSDALGIYLYLPVVD